MLLMRSPIARLLVPCAVAAAFASGCARHVIQGKVLDVKGEALPGVAVEARSTGYQALTDGLGQYRIPYQPGDVTLDFSKTGYTPGILQLKVDTQRHVEATPVSLWPLPEGRGVYLFEKYQYIRTDFVIPEPYRNKRDASVVYGVPRASDVQTTNNEPMIICYGLQPYDAKLTRMELREVEPDIGERMEKALRVWAAAGDLPITYETIDEPEKHLFHIKPVKPLEYGSYAVHWGALYGATTQEEPRMFFFTVVNPNPPAPQPEKPEKKEEKPADTKHPKPAAAPTAETKQKQTETKGSKSTPAPAAKPAKPGADRKR